MNINRPIFAADNAILNQLRLDTNGQRDLSAMPPKQALQTLFVTVFDHLGNSSPFVYVEDVVAEDIETVAEVALGSNAHQDTFCLDMILPLIKLHRTEESVRCGLPLVLWALRLFNRYDGPSAPIYLEGAFLHMIDMLPEPAVLDFRLGDGEYCFEPSQAGRAVRLTGCVTMKANPRR